MFGLLFFVHVLSNICPIQWNWFDCVCFSYACLKVYLFLWAIPVFLDSVTLYLDPIPLDEKEMSETKNKGDNNRPIPK